MYSPEFEQAQKEWKVMEKAVGQWTWVIWNAHEWIVYHQRPDPFHEYRVVSAEIARGNWSIPWSEMPRPGKRGCDYEAEYSAKQMEIGQQYATKDYPLVLLHGRIVPTGSAKGMEGKA